jgi:hypothetical protein
LAEQEFLDSVGQKIAGKLKAKLEQRGVESSRRRSGPRRHIPRDHAAAHQKLVANYFCEKPLYTPEMFRRRFRMGKPLFLRIVDALSNWSPYFTNRVDAINREGLSPLQKCTAAMRMLAYGTSADQLDEVLYLGASTSLDCLSAFAQGIIEVFGGEYLRPPKPEEIHRLM